MKNKSLVVITVCVIIVAMLFSLSGCGNKMNGLNLGEKSTSVTDTVEGVKVDILDLSLTSAKYEITNNTGKTIETGNENSISLEVEKDGKWYQIKIGDYANTAEALVIMDGQTIELNTSWADTYGTLPDGHFRMLRNFTFEGDYENPFIISAEFYIQ